MSYKRQITILKTKQILCCR